MKLSDSLSGNVVVIGLSGKLMGGEETALFQGTVHEYLNLNKNRFVIDLKNVEWTNSLGLGMLIGGLTAAVKAEGRLVLANITNIENILAITRLVRVFDTFDSVEEAIAALTESK